MVPRGAPTSRKRALILGFLVLGGLVSILILTRNSGPVDVSKLDVGLSYPTYTTPKSTAAPIEPKIMTSTENPTSTGLNSLTIVSRGSKPTSFSGNFFELSSKFPIDTLHTAAKAASGPILVSLSGSVDSARLEQHLRLFGSYCDVFAAVGLGKQDNLKYVREDGVLWITKAKKEYEGKSKCAVVDMLETDFIISKEVLGDLLEKITYKESLLELFYLLSVRGDSVLSCSRPDVDGDLLAPTKSPFIDYTHVNWTFQAKYDLIDVIDERTDRWNRAHGNGPLTYCNTTASKKWFDTYGEQKGNLKNARSSLWDWKLVLDEVGLPLKISSGTLLGWYRQCDFIAYTSDLDTTMPIWMYTPELEKAAAKHNYKLIRTFGNHSLANPKGGFESTFQHIPTGNSLDVFWIYHDKDGKEWTSLWVRPTELHRIYFAPGILVENKHADFQGIRVEVPDDPVEYLYSSYGEQWNVPKSKWTWWNSVSNQHKGPFPPNWGDITTVEIHPLVAEHRVQKAKKIREDNIRKGLFKE